jgi:hypothetical protein
MRPNFENFSKVVAEFRNLERQKENELRAQAAKDECVPAAELLNELTRMATR